MTKPEFPEGYYTDVEEFEEWIEGSEFRAFDPDANHLECDFCSKGVPYSSKPRLSQYMSDRVPHNSTHAALEVNSTRKLSSMGTYCEDCSTKLLLFPCKGYTEVRFFFDLDEDRIYKNPEITDISPADDGIPWDPAEVSEKITGTDFVLHSRMASDVMMAPENIVTFFLSIGGNIDIRELVNYDGTLNSKELGQARKAYEEFAKKHSRVAGGRSAKRKQFRDHVRGDDR